MSALQSHLSALQIPPEYGRSSALEDPSTLAILNEWKRRTGKVLREIKEIIGDRKDSQDGLELEEEAELVFRVAPFTDNEAPWTIPESYSLASDILPTSPPIALLTHILKNKIKPVFNLHPYLSRTTARALPRPAGGPGAAQDYYEGQRWKEHPGLGRVLEWCVLHVPTDKYEDLWPLVIPPTMTLLDDYEIQYKILGVRTVSAMLKNVPPELLKRTGLDGLLTKSLSATIPLHSAPLLHSALLTLLELIKISTAVGTQAHFDQLCNLIGESIINDTWFYADDKPDILLATISALTPIIDALRVGTARFLNALIPQLTHPLRPVPLRDPNIPLQIASLRALNALIPHCAPRMHEWKAHIIDSAARCWVFVFIDGNSKDGIVRSGVRMNVTRAASDADRELPQELKELKGLLQDMMTVLAKACPSVIKDEFAELTSLDQDALGDLFSRMPVV